jgi:TonB family protein
MDISLISRTWAGRVIDGKFPLLQWLGSSASTGVFLTEVEGHPTRRFALKLIAADTLDAEIQMSCWASTTVLSHPHLMGLFHTGRWQIDNVWLIYAVTEYAEEFLSQVLAERALTIAETGEMLNPVIDALAYLHKNGAVHGRLKPSNVMGVNDRLKISSERLHLAGERPKSVEAASPLDAPEIAFGTISPAADIWSLGITLIQTLTRRSPVWEREQGRDPIVPESIPEPFGEIARGCLRNDPARRITLGDIRARLGFAQAPPEPPVKTDRPASGKLVATLVVAIVLASIAALAAFELRSHMTPASPSATEEQPTAENTSLPSPASGQETHETQSPPESRAEDTAALTSDAKKKPAAGTSLGTAQSSDTQTPAAQAQSSIGSLVKGAVARRVLPEILPSAMESIDGKVDVRIRVAVDRSGEVSSARYDSPGTSRYFAKMTLQAAQQWRFKPAHVDGQPVSSVWILAFEFTRARTQITPVEVSP